MWIMAKPNEQEQSAPRPTTLQALGAGAQKWWDNLRVGDGHATAMGRLGLKELTHNLLPAFPQSQHVIEEPGLVGNPTQGEVATARDGPGFGPDQESKLTLAAFHAFAKERAAEAEKRMEQGRDREKEQGREM